MPLQELALMKRFLAPLVLLASLHMGMATVQAATPTYTTEDSTIGDLLDNPQTKAVLEQLIPEFVKADRIDEARGMTLRAVQPYAADMLTDEVLEKIDGELSKLSTSAK
jgi:hypothetical protein